MSSFDTVIIGGGVMGLWTALACARRDERVLLVERRKVGAGSSGRSGAILRQHYSHPVMIAMARYGLQRYAEFAQETGHDIGFRRTGMLLICSRDDADMLEQNIARQRACGVDAHLLAPEEARARFPGLTLGDDIVCGWEPEAGFVDPVRTVRALATCARGAGAIVREGVSATSIHQTESGRVDGVVLDDLARVNCERVILATGPWTRAFTDRLGLDLALTIRRPEQAFFVTPESSNGTQIIVGDLPLGLYWKPEPNGWLRVGRLSYDDDDIIENPDRFDEGVSGPFVALCHDGLATRVPMCRDAMSWGGCAALYTCTPDGQAIIGPMPAPAGTGVISGLFIATGFSGHGFKLGPAVGEGLSAIIRGLEPATFPSSFLAPDRFRAGRTIESAYAYRILG